jgi:hypothetical protein
MASLLGVKVNATLVRKGLENLRKKIPLVSRQRIREVLMAMKKTLSKPGAKPTYPIRWDTAKQRRAFFASDGFGAGIPTKRGKGSGAIQRNWKVISTEYGGDLENPMSHARFVYGTYKSTKAQSRIHRNRWPLLKTVASEEIAKLPKKVRESIKIVATSIGFKVK